MTWSHIVFETSGMCVIGGVPHDDIFPEVCSHNRGMSLACWLHRLGQLYTAQMRDRQVFKFVPSLVLLTLLGLSSINTAWAKVETSKPQHKKTLKAHKPQHKKQQASRVATGPAYVQRAEALEWGHELARRQNLPNAWVTAAISDARMLPNVARLVTPSTKPTAKNWAAYRERFIEPRRIAAGLAFWQEHASDLARAEHTYGVPARIIVGILGVETLYGQHTGSFRILDALATLAFDFPQAHPRAQERQAFFRQELEHFLLMTHQNRADPRSLKGSYAGAMGLPQFMPSSWRRYAVDFDGDGHIDLWNSTADAIGSVANYFRAFEWQAGQPTTFDVQVQSSPEQLEQLLLPDILPTFSAQTMQSLGLQLPPDAAQYPGKLALIELRNGEDAPSFVLGTENFYAVTRYNWSSYYAMAVIELGETIERDRQRLVRSAQSQ